MAAIFLRDRPFPVKCFSHCRFVKNHQGGVALVLALWIMVLLAIMASSFSLSIRRNADLVRNAKDQAQALALAEGGLHYAMMMLLLSDPIERWRADGTIYEMFLAGARIRVQLYDESGKFDINHTEGNLWHALLERVGLEMDEAVGVTDAILDWNDADNFRRVSGAEEKEYEAEGLDYGPRDEPFRSIEELQLVLGVSAKLYAALEPLITINSKQPGIDPSKASKDVLLSLPNINEAMIEEYLAARTESALNNTPPPPVPASLAQKSGGAGKIYSVRVDTQLPDGYTSGLAATIRREQLGSQGPFTSGPAAATITGEQLRSQGPFSVMNWQPLVVASDSLFAESDFAGIDNEAKH